MICPRSRVWMAEKGSVALRPDSHGSCTLWGHIVISQPCLTANHRQFHLLQLPPVHPPEKTRPHLPKLPLYQSLLLGALSLPPLSLLPSDLPHPQ